MNTTTRWGLGRRWLGAAVVLVSVMALVATLRPAPVAAEALDSNEPNDTKATATPIISGSFWYNERGTIDPAGDVDYFSFSANAGDQALIEVYWLEGRLHLFGGSKCGTLLASTSDLSSDHLTLDVELPFTGRYCIRVMSANHPNDGGPLMEYDLLLDVFDRLEPNDTNAQATPIQYGETIDATFTMHNSDHYTFVGHAGDHVIALVDMVVNDYGPILRIVGPTGPLIEHDSGGDASVQAMLPVDGTYYLEADYDAFEGFTTEGPYTLTLDKGIMVSPVTGGKVGSLVFDNDDVLLHFEVAERWTRFFDPDASTIDTDISAFTVFRQYPHTWLTALKYPRTLCIDPTWYEPCAGGWQSIQPHDVLGFRYNLQWLFDGSDVGLSTAGEKIDALAIAPDGRLLLSTVASGSVPGVSSFRDEDVLAFTPTQWGPDTAGMWELYFDGSTIPGLSAEDVTGLDVGPDGALYLSLLDNFTVGGLKCGPTCIIAVHPDGHVEKAWDGRDVGFRFKLDAFNYAGGAALMWP